MILLDTHVLVWLVVAPDRMTPAALGAIELDGEPAISTISAQEIAYLVMRGRIELDRPVERRVRDVLRELSVQPVAPGLGEAIRAGSLEAGASHGDPADRLIYATAVEHGLPLVSADRRLRELDPARVVW